jgi:NADH:ubiquinone oxidoreductase subunit 6 (subunit J)
MIFHYILLLLLSLFSFFVICSKNPVHSALSLISVFLLSAVLLFTLKVEFLALSFIIVYVGAIAILFLFVVMLLNIKLVEITENATRYVPIGIITGLIFLYNIYFGIDSFKIGSITLIDYINDFTNINKVTNIEQIVELLYTEY